MKYHLKWTNIYSNDTGFVGKVSKKEGHFFNVTEPDKAKTYVSAKTAGNDIELLKELGEADNNRFEIIPA